MYFQKCKVQWIQYYTQLALNMAYDVPTSPPASSHALLGRVAGLVGAEEEQRVDARDAHRDRLLVLQLRAEAQALRDARDVRQHHRAVLLRQVAERLARRDTHRTRLKKHGEPGTEYTNNCLKTLEHCQKYPKLYEIHLTA